MLYKLGRFLQFTGLFVIVPLAISGNVANKLDVKEFLLCASAGMLVFFVGWSLQQAGKPP